MIDFLTLVRRYDEEILSLQKVRYQRDSFARLGMTISNLEIRLHEPFNVIQKEDVGRVKNLLEKNCDVRDSSLRKLRSERRSRLSEQVIELLTVIARRYEEAISNSRSAHVLAKEVLSLRSR